jgi:hypothetical protein
MDVMRDQCWDCKHRDLDELVDDNGDEWIINNCKVGNSFNGEKPCDKFEEGDPY